MNTLTVVLGSSLLAAVCALVGVLYQNRTNGGKLKLEERVEERAKWTAEIERAVKRADAADEDADRARAEASEARAARAVALMMLEYERTKLAMAERALFTAHPPIALPDYPPPPESVKA